MGDEKNVLTDSVDSLGSGLEPRLRTQIYGFLLFSKFDPLNFGISLNNLHNWNPYVALHYIASSNYRKILCRSFYRRLPSPESHYPISLHLIGRYLISEKINSSPVFQAKVLTALHTYLT